MDKQTYDALYNKTIEDVTRPDLDLYNQIKEFVSPGDTIYYLGDALDRGPQPWELAKIICDDEQFIYLKGNKRRMLQ